MTDAASDADRGVRILPSLLACDMGRLAEECRRAERAGADAMHLDVMDGHFVPNLTFGPDICRAVRRAFAGPLHVHLMVSHPDRFVGPFARAGADTLLVHVETGPDLGDCLRGIRAEGVRPGVTLNPETPAVQAAPWIESGLAEEALCMSVHPGFGGQAFLPTVLPKIAELRRRRPDLRISVDGGVDAETGPACAAAGADLLIAGTFLFGARDMAAEIGRLRAAAQTARAGP